MAAHHKPAAITDALPCLPRSGRAALGSGGATLRVLAQLAREDDTLTSKRILIIHSVGDSRRLPTCSATGKLFARVPRVLPDGRASTVFDEFLIGLCGLSSVSLPPGVLVASGDVLLVFDHLQISFQRGGVIGVAAAAPVEMGLRHGVYVLGDSAHRAQKLDDLIECAYKLTRVRLGDEFFLVNGSNLAYVVGQGIDQIGALVRRAFHLG